MDTFENKLSDAHANSIKSLKGLVGSSVDWSTRNDSKDHGMAAANQMKGLLIGKAAEAKEAIKMLRNSHLKESQHLNDDMLVTYYQAVMGKINERAELMVRISAQDSPKGGKDESLSSAADLQNLREKGLKMMKNIDVQNLVYQVLPTAEAKDAYVETLGRNVDKNEPMYMKILEKTERNEPLSSADFEVLTQGLKKLEGQSLNAMRQAPLVMMLGALKPLDRFQLLKNLSQDPTFLDLGKMAVSMAAGTYLTQDQALVVIDETIKSRTAQNLPTEELMQARKLIEGPRMKSLQKQVLEARKQGAEHMRNVSYGHKNRVGNLLTFKGVGSAFLMANGALTVAANFFASIVDKEGKFTPMAVVGNEALWLGAAEMGAGWYTSKGLEGLVSSPANVAASLLKDRNEEKDDTAKVNLENFKVELGNHREGALFYVNFAQRIESAFMKQKTKNPAVDPKITFKELGIKTAEDLPEGLRPLYQQKEEIEATISEWAVRFNRETGNGIALKTPAAQAKFIQDNRLEQNGMLYPDYQIPFLA